jgi:hypothetical protein
MAVAQHIDEPRYFDSAPTRFRARGWGTWRRAAILKTRGSASQYRADPSWLAEGRAIRRRSSNGAAMCSLCQLLSLDPANPPLNSIVQLDWDPVSSVVAVQFQEQRRRPTRSIDSTRLRSPTCCLFKGNQRTAQVINLDHGHLYRLSHNDDGARPLSRSPQLLGQSAHRGLVQWTGRIHRNVRNRCAIRRLSSGIGWLTFRSEN